jgi:DNA-directed RNA polymerase specialized sigma24 family protein
MNGTAVTLMPDLSFQPGTDDPTSHFTEVYSTYRTVIEGVVRREVRVGDVNLAEDLAAEVFTEYWRSVVAAGKPVANAGGLLRHMARRQVLNHYRIKRNTMSQAYDLTDPKYTPILADAAEVDAATASEAATLTEELDAALETMTEASQAWKKACRATRGVRNGARGGMRCTGRDGRTPAWRAKVEEREGAERKALDYFRATCERVGQIRIALNSCEGVAV